VGDAEAGEHADRAVVERDRDRDLDRLLAAGEDVDQVGVDPEGLSDEPELLPRDLVRVLAQVRWGFRSGQLDSLPR
jgi:hypothetical protein